MRNSFLLAASAAFFVSGASASDVVPNHIRHPLHAAAVKTLAPKSVVRMGATASSASTYAPTLAPGGLSNANIIAGLSWSALLGDTATYADNSVQQADIGSTVAGLDNSGNVTAPVLTNSAVLGPTVSSTIVPTVYSFINPQSTNIASGNGPFYWWDGPAQMRIGGTPIKLPHNPYVSSTGVPQAGTYQSLVLNGNPTGGYNAGCVLCLFMEPSDMKQAAVSAEPPQSGYVPSADGVEVYGAVPNANFDMIVPAASYTATTVVLKDVLTAAELSHIQPGMTIFTNSQVPNVTPSTPEAADYYMGVISSVSTSNGVTTITVYGWSQQLTTSAGAVPSTTSLETYFWAGQTGPVVGIGGFNKAFGRNLFMSYDGAKSGATGGKATSLVHSYAGEEVDMTITNETRAGSVKVQAHTFAMNVNPAYTDVLTHDSEYTYVGGPLPTYFKTGDECYPDASGIYDEGAYVSASSWIGGACKLGELETVLKRYDQEVMEFDGHTTGLGYPYRLMYHLAENTPGGGTTQSNVTPKLGIVLDGTQGQGVDGGSLLADLQWNWGGNSGGLAICGYGVNCGFLVDGYGVTHAAAGGLSGGNGLIVGSQYSGHVAAAGVYAAAGYFNNLFELMNGATEEFSVDASGNVETAGNVVVSDGKSLGLNGSDGSLIGYQYLADATSTKGAIVHQVVTNQNGLAGTYYIDGAFGTGGLATLASLETLNAATFDAGATIPVGQSYAIKSSAGVTSLTADTSGNFTIVQGASNVGGGVKMASYTLANLPTTVASDGTQLWCSDCKLNGIAGVAAYWHATAARWTDSQNGTLAN